MHHHMKYQTTLTVTNLILLVCGKTLGQQIWYLLTLVWDGIFFCQQTMSVITWQQPISCGGKLKLWNLNMKSKIKILLALADFPDQGFLIIIINTSMLYMQSDSDTHPRSVQQFSHNITNSTPEQTCFILTCSSLPCMFSFWCSHRAVLILFWHRAFPSAHRCVILTAVHPAKRWVSQLPRYYL